MNTRQVAIRKLQCGINAINQAATYLNEVETVYRENHPEISDNILDVMSGLSILIDGIDGIKRGL